MEFWLLAKGRSPKNICIGERKWRHCVQLKFDEWTLPNIRMRLTETDSHDLRRLMTKPTKWHVRPAKTQISLGIRQVCSESSLCAQSVAKDPSFLYVEAKTDQTGRMPRLIWVFAGRTCYFVGFVMRRLIYQVITNCKLIQVLWCDLIYPVCGNQGPSRDRYQLHIFTFEAAHGKIMGLFRLTPICVRTPGSQSPRNAISYHSSISTRPLYCELFV